MMEITIGDQIGLIDEDDYEKIKDYKWYLDKDGYAISAFKRNGKTQNIKMHQLIFGKKNGHIIDHINHNKIDNQKSNLRHITRQANAMNMRKQCGVYWNEKRKKWIVQIRINAKTKHIGCYKEKNDAIQSRIEAEEKYFIPFFKGE